MISLAAGACTPHHNVSKRDATLLAALQVNRAGQRFVAIERAARDAGNLLISDDRPAIEHDSYASPDEREVEGVPFGGLAWRRRRGRKKSVDASRAPVGRLEFGSSSIWTS